MIPHNEWRWFGNAAHFIGARDCQFHLATEVGRVVVSTVGGYVPRDIKPGILTQNAEGFTEIGWQRFYETFVFEVGDPLCECGCGARTITDFYEIDSAEYQTNQEANVGHLEMCEKWAACDQLAALDAVSR